MLFCQLFATEIAKSTFILFRWQVWMASLDCEHRCKCAHRPFRWCAHVFGYINQVHINSIYLETTESEIAHTEQLCAHTHTHYKLKQYTHNDNATDKIVFECVIQVVPYIGLDVINRNSKIENDCQVKRKGFVNKEKRRMFIFVVHCLFPCFR